MFLRVPKHSKTLSTGLVPKLSPRYCGPFRVLSNVAYKLELPETSQVHPVFHVSRLRKRLHDGDNVVDTGVLVEYTEPPVEPVMTRVRLVHGGIRFRCTREPDRQPGAGHGLRAWLGRGLGDKEMTCKASRRSTGSKRVIGARRAAV